MELLDLRVERLIVHEVFERADDRNAVPPVYGTALERLDGDATDAIRNRIVAAIASSAKCMQMTIATAGAESMCALVSERLTRQPLQCRFAVKERHRGRLPRHTKPC